MLKKVKKKTLDLSLYCPFTVLKVNGAYSGSRPILHLSFVEICFVVAADKPTNHTPNKWAQLKW